MDAYNSGIHFDASMLQLDKVDVVISGLTVTATAHEMHGMLCSLQQPFTLRDGRETGWVFRSYRAGELHQHTKIAIQSSTQISHSNPSPLFSGHLFVHGTSGGLDGRNYYTLNFHLTLNPTRFASCQRLERLSDGHCELNLSAPRIRFRPETPRDSNGFRIRRIGDERPLYDCNNFIRGASYQAARAQLNELLHHYINAVTQQLRQEIETAAVGTDAELSPNEFSYNLKYAEAYADLETVSPANPIEAVASITRAITSYGGSYQVRAYEIDNMGSNQLSNYFRIKIGTGCELSVYAKTSHRVRFEVKADLTKCPRILHPQGSDSMAHTTPSLPILCTWLSENIRAHAAGELNRFFRHIEASGCPVTETHSCYSLLSVIGEVCGSETGIILSSLIHSGGISIARRLSPYRRIVDGLMAKGVLERAGNSHKQQYRLTPEYRLAVERLAALDAAP